MRNLLAIVIMLVILTCCTGKKTGGSKYNEFVGNVYVDTVVKTSEDKTSLIMIACYWDDIDSHGPFGHISVEENDESKGKCHIKHISNDSIVLEHDNSDLFFTGKNTTTLYRLRN